MAKWYQIEALSVKFFIIVICFCLLFVSIGIKKYKDGVIDFGDNAIYTTESMMSLSNNTASVVDVFKSKDNTKAVLLFKFDEMSNLSTDAKNYRLFLTATSFSMKREPLLSAPVGGLYVFGDTGYMAVYLIDRSGIKNQILDLIVRQNKNLQVYDTEELDPKDFSDTSFHDFDQMRIYFNPFGKKAKIADFLENNTIDVYDMYNEMINKDRVFEIKEELNKKLYEMHIDMLRIEELKDKLMRYGLTVKSIPESISADTITASYQGKPLTLTEKGQYVTDNDEVILEKDIDWVLNTPYTVQGGFDFDWRSKDIKDRILDELRENKSEYEYLKSLRNQKENDKNTFQMSQIRIVDEKGHDIEFTGSNDVLKEYSSRVQTVISDYSTTLSTYFAHKYEYQVVLLGSLIDLELSSKLANIEYTYADDILKTY